MDILTGIVLIAAVFYVICRSWAEIRKGLEDVRKTTGDSRKND